MNLVLSIPDQAAHLASFRAFVQQKVMLSEADWKRTAESLECLRVSAGTPLLREGEVCRHLFFLCTGLVRFFEWRERDGNDATKFFTTENYLFTSQQSFSTQTPARENIETLEECVLLRLSYDALQSLYDDVPAWNTFVRLLLQEVNVLTEEMLMDSLQRTAEERYGLLLTDEPEIALRAPLRHIASYLGITPESLSRIRRKRADGK
jgi:CRP-like cAMP-binding protein